MKVVDQLLMTHLVKCFAEIQQDDMCLSTSDRFFIYFLGQHSELCFTWPPGLEAILEVIEDLILAQVFTTFEVIMCSNNLHWMHVRDIGLKLARHALPPFLKMGETLAFNQSEGQIPP